MAAVADRVASQRINVVLADDHAMVRSGLRRVLDAEADLSVVGEAGDVETALDETLRHQPQVVVLDLNMRGRRTLAAIPELLEAAPGSAVIVLTMESDPLFARRALSAGARGYVLKEAAEGALVDAVRCVVEGRTYLDPGLGARLVSAAADPAELIPGLSHGDPRLAVGLTFAGHRIDAVLGRGGMGLVFRATDCALDRVVAMKVIAPAVASDRGFRARFERECRIAASIDHPHVVQIFHAGEENGLMYLTMHYIDGIDLRRLLRDNGPLEPRRAISIVAQIASALDEAHRLGLIHRDVKPANVLIEKRFGRELAFLSDFGVTTSAARKAETRTGVPLGTVDYMAPEQAEGGDVDARADVYSLGCVLFQALTGEIPFDRDSDLRKLWAHAHDPPPKLLSVSPELPRGLEEVLDRALAKEPSARQQSAGEFATAALDAIAR